MKNKIMKFVSKSGNYRIILDRGLPAEPMTGRSAVPGLSVKFEDGIAIVTNEEIIKRLLEHESLGRDFIKVDEAEADPFKASRQPIEPEHDMTTLEYGHVGKNQNPKPAITLTPEIKKVLTDMAVSMAKEMAPQLAVELIQKMKADSDAAAIVEENAPAKKAGRPKKPRKVVSEKQSSEATEG